MDDAALVRRGEARADLPRDLERAILRKAADAPEQDARSSPSTYSIERNVWPSTSSMS